MSILFRPIAVSAVLLLIGSASVNADDEKPEKRTISVSGQGKISAAPDVAAIKAGVVTQAKTAREALSDNNEKMAALQAVLKERGVAAKDVQTSHISVQPQYSQPNPGQPQPHEFVPRVVGYQVQNTVQITARDLTKLGSLLDAVVDSGANQMYGISFHIDKPESLLNTARKSAMADAKAKAELIAGEAGVVVGMPISIRDEAASSPPPPTPMYAMRGMVAAPSVPVAAGEQELGVTVHVVYELKAPK